MCFWHNNTQLISNSLKKSTPLHKTESVQENTASLSTVHNIHTNIAASEKLSL
jgi:hypothetical protein